MYRQSVFFAFCIRKVIVNMESKLSFFLCWFWFFLYDFSYWFYTKLRLRVSWFYLLMLMIIIDIFALSIKLILSKFSLQDSLHKSCVPVNQYLLNIVFKLVFKQLSILFIYLAFSLIFFVGVILFVTFVMNEWHGLF